jgi:hypothetical protein
VTREGQRRGVADQPGEVAQPHPLLPRLGLLDHGGREVDADHMAGDPGQGAGDQAGAAGHIQHRVEGADPGQVDQELVRLVVRPSG